MIVGFQIFDLILFLLDNNFLAVDILIFLLNSFLDDDAICLRLWFLLGELLHLVSWDLSLESCVLELGLHIIVLIIEYLNLFGMVLTTLLNLFLKLIHILLQLHHRASDSCLFISMHGWLSIGCISGGCPTLFSSFEADLDKCAFILTFSKLESVCLRRTSSILAQIEFSFTEDASLLVTSDDELRIFSSCRPAIHTNFHLSAHLEFLIECRSMYAFSQQLFLGLCLLLTTGPDNFDRHLLSCGKCQWVDLQLDRHILGLNFFNHLYAATFLILINNS